MNQYEKKNLVIKWKRLINDGKTCHRCGSTEEELEEALLILKQSLSPLGIEVVLEKEEISFSEFKKDPLNSNSIWIDDSPIENYIKANTGKSLCSDVCESYECRKIEIDGTSYETIPSEIIVKAGLIAASNLISIHNYESCCDERCSCI
ncbi:MAG: DUF2703 domain-containing protein [Brevinematales bacterium]|nr:DUF2703 domain-containing protein [Brevinematales bacterium]